LVTVVDGVTAAAPALFETVTVYSADVACEDVGNGMSVSEDDDEPTGLPSLRHAHVVGAEPPLQLTVKFSEAPLATTGPCCGMEQSDGGVIPLPASAMVPVTVLQRVG